MNGSRVRGGEGRFITFYFIIFYTISFFIYKKKYESYKSTLTNPHPWPISYNKKITENLKNSIIFFRFTTTFPEYSIILFKTVPAWTRFPSVSSASSVVKTVVKIVNNDSHWAAFTFIWQFLQSNSRRKRLPSFDTR